MVDTEKANILIVDDRTENLLALQNLLEGPDRRIFKANWGSEVLALMNDYEFAVMLLDTHMPKLNAFEIAKLLRSSQRISNTPLIFITAAEQEPPAVLKGCEAGVLDYLVKPFEGRILQSKVKVFLELYRHRQALQKTAEALEQAAAQLERANRKIREQQQTILEEKHLKALLQMPGPAAHELKQPLMTPPSHTGLLEIVSKHSNHVAQQLDTIPHTSQSSFQITNEIQTPHGEESKPCSQEDCLINFSERPLKILCVEDALEDFDCLKAMLKPHRELRLSRVSGIRETFDYLENEQVDVILVEHQLRDGNCFDFLQSIAGRGLAAPVIVVTSKGSELLAAEVIQAGAYAYLPKSGLSDTCLLRSIHNALKRCCLKEEMRAAISRMAEMSIKDELTGLYNRRYFTEALEREIARVKRYGGRLALCMIDLDHFKMINDTFGHPAGDTALAHTGRILLESTRQSDLACRYGGDEFALILPHTTLEEATKVCERIRTMVEEYRFTHGTLAFHLTTSIGVATFDSNAHETAVDLVSAADQALYGSKKEGRNGVTWGSFQSRNGLTLYTRRGATARIEPHQSNFQELVKAS